MNSAIIKSSDAQNQWSELLDRAAQGEVIKIERAGVVFYLGTFRGVTNGQKRIVDSAITLGQVIERHKAKPVNKDKVDK